MANKGLLSCPELKYVYSICQDRNTEDSSDHRRAFGELILFERGKGIHSVNGRLHPFGQGSIALLSPTDAHGWKNCENSSHDCTKIKFSHYIWRNQLKEICQFDRIPVVADLCKDDYEKALRIIDLLMSEHNKQEQTDDGEFALNLIASLMVLTKRNLHNSVNTNASRTREILLYIQEHFCEPITVTDVAKALNYSPKYFSRLFVNELGVPFHEYIKNLLLN